LREKGFDHIRLPFNVNNSIDSNGKLIEEHMQKLDRVIYLALNAGISLVLDLHGFKNLNGNYSGTRQDFISVWTQIAERYETLPLSIAFELINEPRVDRTKSDSNPDPLKRGTLMTLQEDTIAAIRTFKGNKERRIAISTHINMIGEIGSITQKLLNTENLILDIHYYSPMSFSHSGADWITTVDENGNTVMTYPKGATKFSDESNKNVMVKLNNFRNQHPNFIVWIGEWGAFNPNYEAKLQYYASITNYARQYNIPRALWEYGSAWGPYRSNTDTWIEEILVAMGL
ncbi:MAG: glycoside hydrolase family 5 protein, partial [Acutalibacteraceae bacterium]